jgi:hypothetical protein
MERKLELFRPEADAELFGLVERLQIGDALFTAERAVADRVAVDHHRGVLCQLARCGAVAEGALEKHHDALLFLLYYIALFTVP